MGLSVWRETSKNLTVYRVCYTPIETLIYLSILRKLAAISPFSFEEHLGRNHMHDFSRLP